MRRFNLSIPELALISGTRAALGAGLGLLLGGRLATSRRLAAGWSLLGVGLLTTIPIVAQLLGAEREPHKHHPRRDVLRAHRARRARSRANGA